MAAQGRFVGRICLNSFIWMVIFADDVKITAGGQDKWIVILRCIVMWLLMGTPFAWHKFRGGLQCDFVGFWLDYVNFEVGLSEKRTE